jgi:pimeloyl-ACP methyl ester carboxylesterase
VPAFVLVHGAWGGAHGFRHVRRLLAGAGHEVFTPSLTGIGERVHLVSPQVDLSTHVTDMVNTVLYEDLDDLVLLGFSYGGMVVTGALDAIGDRVRSLVYLDAFVPDDGDSCYAMTDDEQRAWYLADAEGGPGVAPLPFFDARAKPHPRASLLQRITLVDNWHQVPVKHYVVATGWPGRSPFADTAERIRRTPGWTVHDWPTTHNVLADGPDAVVDLLTTV